MGHGTSCTTYIASDGWVDFWDYVVLKRHNDCWPWVGPKQPRGYGFFANRGNQIAAHRYSYIQEHGEIPDGLVVRHTCDNPNCVNPRHLEAGTHKDNYQDMISRGRSRWQKRMAVRIAAE